MVYEALHVRQAVAAKLRLLRLRAGLSLAQVAERMGSHRPIVGRLESGRHDVELDSLFRFCAAVGAHPNAVLVEVDRVLSNGARQALQPKGGEPHGAGGGKRPHRAAGTTPGRPAPRNAEIAKGARVAARRSDRARASV